MRHAFIITAYSEFEMLYKQLTAYAKEFDCYVHIDKKSQVPSEMMQQLKGIPNVTIVQKYKINWGGIQHVYAILDLLNMAVKSGNKYTYYHIMSANSMLIKKVDEFYTFFEEHAGKNFIEMSTEKNFPNPEEVRERYRYYYFQHLYNIRGKYARLWKRFEIYSKRIQAKLKVKRKRQFPYKGYVYCSLTDTFVNYILSYCNAHPEYIRAIKYCWVSEEFFFQNLIMESEFAETVVNDSLIFSIWDDPTRKKPATLDMRDYETLLQSAKVFARKISAEEASKELFDRMLEHCFK